MPPAGRHMPLLQSVNLTARVLCSEIEVPLLGEMFNKRCGRLCDVMFYCFLLCFLKHYCITCNLAISICQSFHVLLFVLNSSKDCVISNCVFALLIMAQDSTLRRCYLSRRTVITLARGGTSLQKKCLSSLK